MEQWVCVGDPKALRDVHKRNNNWSMERSGDNSARSIETQESLRAGNYYSPPMSRQTNMLQSSVQQVGPSHSRPPLSKTNGGDTFTEKECRCLIESLSQSLQLPQSRLDQSKPVLGMAMRQETIKRFSRANCHLQVEQVGGALPHTGKRLPL